MESSDQRTFPHVRQNIETTITTMKRTSQLPSITGMFQQIIEMGWDLPGPLGCPRTAIPLLFAPHHSHTFAIHNKKGPGLPRSLVNGKKWDIGPCGHALKRMDCGSHHAADLNLNPHKSNFTTGCNSAGPALWTLPWEVAVLPHQFLHNKNYISDREPLANGPKQ